MKQRLAGDEIVEWSFVAPCSIEARRGPLFSPHETYKLHVVPEDDLHGQTKDGFPDPSFPTRHAQDGMIGRHKVSGALVESCEFPVRACTSCVVGYYEDAIWHFSRVRTPLQVKPVLSNDRSVTVHIDINKDEEQVTAIKTTLSSISGSNYVVERTYSLDELEISAETNLFVIKWRNLMPNTGYTVTAWPVGKDGKAGQSSLATKVVTLSAVTLSVEDTGDTFLRICFRRPPLVPPKNRGLDDYDARIGEYTLKIWEDPTESLLRNAARLSRGSQPQRYPLRRSEFIGKDVPAGKAVSILVERLRPDTPYFLTLATKTDTLLWEEPARFRVRTTKVISIARDPFVTSTTLSIGWNEPVVEELPNCLLDVDFPANTNYFTDRDVSKPYIGDKRKILLDGKCWNKPAQVLSGVLAIGSSCELHASNTSNGAITVATSDVPEVTVERLDPAELYMLRFRRVPAAGDPLPFTHPFLMFTPSTLMCRDVCRSRTSITIAWGQLEVKTIAQLDPPPGHFKYLPDQHPVVPTQGDHFYYLEPIPFICGPQVDAAVLSDSEDEEEVYADGIVTGSGCGYLGKRSRLINREPRPPPLEALQLKIDESEFCGAQIVCLEGALEGSQGIEALIRHNYYRFDSIKELLEARWGSDRIRGYISTEDGRFGKHCFQDLEPGKTYTFILAAWQRNTVSSGATRKNRHRSAAEDSDNDCEEEYVLKLVAVHRSATLPAHAVEHQAPLFENIDETCQDGWSRFVASRALTKPRGANLKLTEVSEVFVALDVSLNSSDEIENSLKLKWLDAGGDAVPTEYLVEVTQVDMQDGVRIVVGEPRIVYYCAEEPSIQVVNLVAAARYELRVATYEPSLQQWSSFSCAEECTTVQKVFMELKEMSSEYVQFKWGRLKMDNITSYTFRVADLGLAPATFNMDSDALQDHPPPYLRLYKTKHTTQRVDLLDELRHNALFDCSVVPHYDNGEQGLASNLLRFAHCVVGGKVVEAGVSHLNVTWEKLDFEALFPPCQRGDLAATTNGASGGNGTCLLRLRTVDGSWERTVELPSSQNSFIFEGLPPNTNFCCHVAFVAMVPRCACCPPIDPAAVLPVAGRFSIMGETLPIPSAAVTKIGESFVELAMEFRAEPQHEGEVLLELQLKDHRRAETLVVEVRISGDDVRRGRAVAIAEGLRAGREYDVRLRQQYSLGTWGLWVKVITAVPTLPKVQITVVSLGETFVGLAASRDVPSLENYTFTLMTSNNGEAALPPEFIQPSKFKFTVKAIGTVAESHTSGGGSGGAAPSDPLSPDEREGVAAALQPLEIVVERDEGSAVIQGLMPNTPYAAAVQQWALAAYGELSAPANFYTLQQVLPVVLKRTDNYLEVGCARDKRMPTVVTTVCGPLDDASAARLSPLSGMMFAVTPLSEPGKPTRSFTVPCTEQTLLQAVGRIAMLTPTHAYCVEVTPIYSNGVTSSAPAAVATLTQPLAAFRVSTVMEDSFTLTFCQPEGAMTHFGAFGKLPSTVRHAPADGVVTSVVAWEFLVEPLIETSACASTASEASEGRRDVEDAVPAPTTVALPLMRRAFQDPLVNGRGSVTVTQAADKSGCSIVGLMPDVTYKLSARSIDATGAVDAAFHPIGTILTRSFQTVVVNKLSENFAEIAWEETQPSPEAIARRSRLHSEYQLDPVRAMDWSNMQGERHDDMVEVLLVKRADMAFHKAERRCLPYSAGSVLLEQLSPETTYVVYVRLKRLVDDENGGKNSVDGSWLPETQFDTLALLLLRVVHIGLDFVNLTWQAADRLQTPSTDSRANSPPGFGRRELPSTLFGTTTYFCCQREDGDGSSLVSGSSAMAVRFQLRTMLMSTDGGPGELLDDMFVTSTKDGLQTINGLQPGTAYAISMRVCYETLSGSWVTPAQVTTERISEPKIVDISQSSGEFQFSVVESEMPGGAAVPPRRHRLYEILTNDKQQYVPYTRGSVGTIRVGGLLRDFRYRIRIREVIQGRRFGEFVEFVVFWTQPYPPMITELVECRGNWCTIRWNVVATQHRPTSAMPITSHASKSFIYLLEKGTIAVNPSNKKWQQPAGQSLAVGGVASAVHVTNWQQVCITDKPEHRFKWKEEGGAERFSRFAFRVRLTKMLISRGDAQSTSGAPALAREPVWGKYSPIACWREPSPPMHVSHLELVSITPLKAVVQWRVPEGADAQPNLRYTVSLDPSRVSGNDTPEQWFVVSTTTKLTCEIENLQPASTYRVSVRSESAFGLSARSTIIAFTTRPRNAIDETTSRALVPFQRTSRSGARKPGDSRQLVVGSRPTQLEDDVPHNLFDKYQQPQQRKLRALAQLIGLNKPSLRSLSLRKTFRTAAHKCVVILHKLHEFTVATLLNNEFNPNGDALSPYQQARAAFGMTAHGSELRWNSQLFKLNTRPQLSNNHDQLQGKHTDVSGMDAALPKQHVGEVAPLEATSFGEYEVVPPLNDADHLMSCGFSPLHIENTLLETEATKALLTTPPPKEKQRQEDVTWTPHRDDGLLKVGYNTSGPSSKVASRVPSALQSARQEGRSRTGSGSSGVNRDGALSNNLSPPLTPNEISMQISRRVSNPRKLEPITSGLADASVRRASEASPTSTKRRTKEDDVYKAAVDPAPALPAALLRKINSRELEKREQQKPL